MADAIFFSPAYQVMLVEVDESGGPGVDWTFTQVEERSNRVAHLFLSRGFGRGDVVALIMTNRAEFVIAQLALSKIGAVAALVNASLRGSALAHVVRVAGCRACVCEERFEEEVATARAEMGATGLPVYVVSDRTGGAVRVRIWASVHALSMNKKSSRNSSSSSSSHNNKGKNNSYSRSSYNSNKISKISKRSTYVLIISLCSVRRNACMTLTMSWPPLPVPQPPYPAT